MEPKTTGPPREIEVLIENEVAYISLADHARVESGELERLLAPLNKGTRFSRWRNHAVKVFHGARGDSDLLLALALVALLDGAGTEATRTEDAAHIARNLPPSFPWGTPASVEWARQRRAFAASMGVDSDTAFRQLRLIRFRGHLPRGGYDVHNARHETETASAQLH
jgi:hypothetical protein